jgi:hypothetical protein
VKNVTLLATQKDFNPFTEELKARCEAHGEVLVGMRNGDYCKVVYKPGNPDEFESEGFMKADHSACWHPNGESFTSSRFDLIDLD